MPGVLLEQKRDGIVILEDLYAMRRVDVPRPSKRQTTSGVVAVGHNVVVGPFLPSPFCVRKVEGFCSAFGVGQRFSLSFPGQGFTAGTVSSLLRRIEDTTTSHICCIGIGPMTAQVRLSIGKPRCGTGRSCRLLAASSTAASSTTSAACTLSGCCSTTCGRATSRTGGRTALLTRGGLNGNDHLHKYQRSKDHCN